MIDNLNTYTEVAQSVFRLRKLNQGHTIQLYSININDDYNKTDITDILVDRDDKNKKLKFKNLTYQIIKANVRATRKKLNKTKEIFNEDVKHIFMEGNRDIIDNEEILKGILTDSEIKSHQKLINIILLNEPSKLKELVYNINSSSFAINEVKSTQINANIDQSKVNQTNNRVNDIGRYDFSKYSHNYKYTHDKIVKNYNLSNLYDLENVLFNPSILTSLNYYYKAYFNPLLLVIKKDNLDIIIIPATDIYLYSNDLIVNILGNSINYNLFEKEPNIDKIIELQKNSEFIKFLSNDINIFNKLLEKENYILFVIFLKINGAKKIINSNDIEFLKRIYNMKISTTKDVINKIKLLGV